MVSMSVLVDLEESLNREYAIRHSGASFCIAEKYNAAIMQELKNVVDTEIGAEKDDRPSFFVEIVQYIKRLNNTRFLRTNGEIKEATFYQYAHIDKTTWSDMKWDQVIPSKKTILKLVLALELSFPEAEAMLARWKQSFDKNDIQDRVIIGIISIRERHKLEIQDVMDLLYEYQDQYKDTKPFDCIYDTPEMIAERKRKNFCR